jgi:hypothetical protein
MVTADFNKRVRLKLYELFVADGYCPKLESVAAALNCGVAEVRAAAKQLADAHMLVLQPGSGEVLMANPLSAVPTPFVVETCEKDKTRSWYGNCIWDALGVIAMLNADGRVFTSCGCCGDGMAVSVKGNVVMCEPAGIVHFAIPAKHWWDDIVFN